MLHILNKFLTKSDLRKVVEGNGPQFGLHGHFRGILLDQNGKIIDEVSKDNLIVNNGFDLIADALGKSASRPAVISHIAIGTSSTAPAATQTALITEIARVAATYAHTGGTKTFTMSGTFNPGTGTGAIVESGVLNAAASGTLLDRVTFSVVNKGANDTLTTTFTFTMT